MITAALIFALIVLAFIAAHFAYLARAQRRRAEDAEKDLKLARRMLTKRFESFDLGELSDAMMHRMLRDIFGPRPSPATPGTIDELMPRVVEEPSE